LGVLGLDRAVEVDASPLVEVNHMVDAGGRFEWVSMLNLSGQTGPAGFFDPLPMWDIEVRVRPRKPVASARLLYGRSRPVVTREAGGRVSCTVPELGNYEVLLLEYAR